MLQLQREIAATDITEKQALKKYFISILSQNQHTMEPATTVDPGIFVTFKLKSSTFLAAKEAAQ